MSYHITEAEIRKFDPDVKGIYQANSRLKFFNTNSAAGSSSYQVVRFGTGIGSQSVPGSDIPNMNSKQEKAVIYLENWNHAEYVDYFQQNEVNWDAISKAAKEVCAPAAGRRKDQIIINTMESIPNAHDVPWNYDGNIKGISSKMVQRANSVLSWYSVPLEERYIVAPYLVLEEMLSSPEFTSRDYVRDFTPALDGEIIKFGGFKWVFISNNPEGGMPYVDNGDGTYTYSCFACHKRALEVAVGAANMGGSEAPMTRVDRVPEKGSWIINTPLSCGAAVVEDHGIVRIQAKATPIAA